MISRMELPGLERLMEVCRRLDLEWRSAPPRQSPLEAGALIEGLPFDPMLAAVYVRFGYASFAPDVAGLILHRFDDEDLYLEEENKRWRESYREQFALPTFLFAGEPGMAYQFATLPTLADDQGCQPVVRLDIYEEPYAMPVASNVDRLFDAYSHYLEALMDLPQAREEGATLLTFPWKTPSIVGRDARLVELIRQGAFDALMPGAEERAWADKVVRAVTSPR